MRQFTFNLNEYNCVLIPYLESHICNHYQFSFVNYI